MALFSELNELMVNYRFRPERKLAQHFIIDEALIQRMISLAELKEKDTVLEIGAGTGFLTRELQKQCKVKAVELDENFCKLLRETLPKQNLEIFHGNFLQAKIGKYNKVVSLPPYTISSELVYNILEHGFDIAVLVMQREFLHKLVAEPGFFEYCALSVFTQYKSVPQLLDTVSPNSFFPKPNAFSSIIKLSKKKRFGTVHDEAKFKFFLQQIFRYKNKNLRNAMRMSFQFMQKELKLKQKGFDKSIEKLDCAEEKVYLLETKHFVQVFNAIMPKK